jgi:hypothetical protein
MKQCGINLMNCLKQVFENTPELKINPAKQILNAKHTITNFINGAVIWTKKNI